MWHGPFGIMWTSYLSTPAMSTCMRYCPFKTQLPFFLCDAGPVVKSSGLPRKLLHGYDQLRPSQARPKNVSPPRVPRGLIFKSYECNSSRTTERPKACLSVPRHILLLLESGMQICWYIRPLTLSCIVSICDTFRCLLCPSSWYCLAIASFLLTSAYLLLFYPFCF